MMKYINIVLIVMSALISDAQPTKVMMDCISKNDLSLANDNMANWVILSINDTASTLRKSEAISQLSSYLNVIHPTSYQRRHSGRAVSNNQSYSVANVSSIEGKHRLFVYAENQNGLVKEIRLTSIQ